ncbi:DUF4430 domain-containing protein [Paenibacillus graminis]|uniref:DUF4430 domain-containing protein n=2 Tax=Paenibacillus graminis TaxID=189425 RepID=UPI0005A683C6|nr:DUF4430 domain-containing protein [Paenibacillus graminis]
MSKSIQQWLSAPLLLLSAAVLLAGCASGADTAGGVQSPAASTAAVQSPQPATQASPLPGDAASPVPSALADGKEAPPSGAESAGTPEGAAVSAPPVSSGAAAKPAPSAAAVTEPASVTGSAAPATAKASAGPAKPAAGAKPAASTKPAATAKPAAGTKPATAKPAATAKAPAASQPAAAASAAPAKPAGAVNTVTLSIVGDKEHGTIFAAAAVDVKDGESALELLKRVTRSNKIQMEYQGAKSFAYVEGIDNLYEFDQGPESGWIYKVNGEVPGKGAGSYTLQPGDTVEWLYTLDMGKDVGAEVQ